MKVGEPNPHMCPVLALARRAHAVEEKVGKVRIAWSKASSLCFNGRLDATGRPAALKASGRSTTTSCPAIRANLQYRVNKVL
jgi:hypothetical protein